MIPCNHHEYMKFWFHRTVDQLFPPPKPYRATNRLVNADDLDWFIDELESHSRFVSLLWMLEKEPSVPTLTVATVESITLHPDFMTAPDPTAFLLAGLHLNAQDQAEVRITLHYYVDLIFWNGTYFQIEAMTRGQGSNPLWALYRKGRLTASNFGPIIKTFATKREPCKSLMKTLLGEMDLSGVKQIQWGIQHEKTAIELYEKAFEVQCYIFTMLCRFSRTLLMHENFIKPYSDEHILSTLLTKSFWFWWFYILWCIHVLCQCFSSLEV